jgi:hypothetical protein
VLDSSRNECPDGKEKYGQSAALGRIFSVREACSADSNKPQHLIITDVYNLL